MQDEITEKEEDEIVASINDLDDIIDAYDNDELMLDSDELDEDIQLNETLSRVARLKAKARMRRTQIKRTKKLKLVLKRKSSNAVLMKRARRIAIKAIKLKLSKKDPSQMSYGDKVRVEKIIAKRKTMVDRLARKLMPKVRSIERTRLTGKRTK